MGASTCEWEFNQDVYAYSIRMIAHRVQTLDIRVDFPPPPSFQNWLDFPFPSATAISINSSEPIPFLAAPALTHLRGKACTLQEFSAHKLTCLDLAGVSIATLQFLLQAFPRLKMLKVDVLRGEKIQLGADGQLSNTRGYFRRYNHTALETLDLNAGSILHMVTLPNLKSLCVWSDHGALPHFLERSNCTLARFGVGCPSDVDELLSIPTATEMVLRVHSLDQCGRIFDHLNARLTPASSLRYMTMFVDASESWIPFESGEPYLFAPALLFYHAHGNRFNWISIETPQPVEFLCLWSKLSTIFPRNIFVNDHPMDHFYRPAVVRCSHCW